MIKKIFWPVICFLLSVILDTALLPRLLPDSVCPLIMAALVLALTASFSLWIGGLAAALGGLAEDLLCSEAIGITSAALLIAAAIFASLLRKNTFKKGILFLIITFLAFAAEALVAFFFRLYGAKFDMLYTLLFGGLGRGLATAACALLFISLFTELKKGRIEQT